MRHGSDLFPLLGHTQICPCYLQPTSSRTQTTTNTHSPTMRGRKVNQPPPHFTASMHVAWGHVKDPHCDPTKRTRAAPKWQTNPTLKLRSCRLRFDSTHKTPHQHLISNIKPSAHRKRCCFLFVLLKSWNTETRNPVRLRPQASAITFRTSHSLRLPNKRPSDSEITFISPINFLLSFETSTHISQPCSKHSILKRDPHYPVQICPQASETDLTCHSSQLLIKRPSDSENTLIAPLKLSFESETVIRTSQPRSKHPLLKCDPQYPLFYPKSREAQQQPTPPLILRFIPLQICTKSTCLHHSSLSNTHLTHNSDADDYQEACMLLGVTSPTLLEYDNSEPITLTCRAPNHYSRAPAPHNIMPCSNPLQQKPYTPYSLRPPLLPVPADTHQIGFSFSTTIYFAIHTRGYHLPCKLKLNSISPPGHKCGSIRKATSHAHPITPTK